ncbi:hypothetical protein Plhal304r1_c007g0029411 [Plasmopara halstedii]
MKDRNRIFADTSLSVNKPLSAIFGAFIGNTSSTYVMVVIQTSPLSSSSQAIQSLLYACKAKEIKNTSPTNYLPFFVNRANTNQYFKTQTNLPQDTEVFASDVHDEITVLQLALENRHPKYFSQTCSPPLSTTSNDSSYESPFAGASTEVSLAHRVSVKGESEESQKQLAVSRRLRIAYDIAKAATDLQSKQSIAYSVQSVQTGDTSSHAAIDESLAHSPCDMIHKQSAQAKLETLKSTHTELERALAHEASIKNKCVDRISRLSQTLNCQMVEHEKQLQAALKAKSAVEDQLRDVNAKFDDAKLEVLRLQEEVKSLRAIQPTLAEHTAANERRMLHTLSARLEQAMIEAKDVITFKDGIITSLENRLELASKRGVDAVTLMQEERSQFEREKTKLFTQLENNKKIINSTENEEILRLKTENLSLQQQNGDLTAQVKHLALDLESARLQWTKEASHREVQAEQRCAQQLVQAEKQLEQVTIAMQQQMAQFRNELDMKVARQRVAAQVACKASSLKCDLVERKLERMKKKGVKQKVKMEEKSRTLLANASKEYDKLVASLQRELMELAERLKAAMTCEENALRRAKKSEEDAERLKVDLEQLQSYTSKLDKERVALSQACKELETDKIAMKAEFEIRTHEMEKLLAKQIMAAEARVHKERDNEIQILTERHNAEIESLQCESNNREKETMSIGLTRKQTPSAESSHTSSGQNDPIVLGENPQKSISDLGELIDSKERRCKNLTKQDRADEKAFIAMKRALLHKEDEIVGLTERQKQLLAALAMANEQETLAKKQSQELELLRQNEASRYEDLLQQLNSVKQENWNLSLALNITEATNQPKSHEI